MKKFIDIDNLKIVWDEINKRFVRNSDISERLEVLNILEFRDESNYNISPNSSCNIDSNYYTKFINFVNSSNSKKYVLDSNGNVWDVICSTFYDWSPTSNKGQFNGIILSNNSNDGDAYFWYMKVTSNEVIGSDTTYLLEWQKYIGELLKGDYITNNEYTREINRLNGIINSLSSRLRFLEDKVGVEETTTVAPIEPGNQYSDIICKVYDSDGSILSNSTITDVEKISQIGDKSYQTFDGPIHNMYYVKNDSTVPYHQITILQPHAIRIKIVKSGYENAIVEIGYDNSEVRVYMNKITNTLPPISTTTSTTTPADKSTPSPGTLY